MLSVTIVQSARVQHNQISNFCNSFFQISRFYESPALLCIFKSNLLLFIIGHEAQQVMGLSASSSSSTFFDFIWLFFRSSFHKGVGATMETTAHFSCRVIIRPFLFVFFSSGRDALCASSISFDNWAVHLVTVSHRIPLGIKGWQAQRVVCFDFLVPFLIGRNWITLDSRNDSLGNAAISFSYLDKMFSLFLVLASLRSSNVVTG
jgi:hypothetical protein